MKVLDIPKSGRCGEVVFYRIRGVQYCRRHVTAKDPRSAAQRRARRNLGAVSQAWSRLLTEEERRDWNARAGQILSRPRLDQAGWLTGEMLFAGLNSARVTIGREILRRVPERVVFGPNPVAGLMVSQSQGRLKLELRVSGPVTEDLMVFGAAPCSAARRKCRKPAYLGLLPTPVGGVSDITEMYVARYGEPKPGQRVFIRTRQQTNGWEGENRDVSEVVGVPELHGLPLVTVRPPQSTRLRTSDFGFRPSDFRSVGWPCPREQYRLCTGVSPEQCRRSTGVIGRRQRGKYGVRQGDEARGRRKGHWRELWRGS